MLDGIDISYAQPRTPSLAGLSFAFARATYGTGADSTYPKHSAAFRNAGIISGAYAFGTFGDGPAQALALLSVAQSADLLALDLETEPGKPPMTEAQARAFIAAVHGVGRQCGLYHSDSGYPFLGQDWDWVAKWGSVPPARKWTFWQWSGAPLDRDKFNGTAADLAALAGKAEGAVVVTDPTPYFVDLAVGVQLYATDGKRPLVKITGGGAGIYSPFGNGAQRAVVVTTGGVRQVAFATLTDCKNIRPFVAQSAAHLVVVTIDGQPTASGSFTY